MNLSPENYVTLLMLANDRREEVKDMLNSSFYDTDKEYWKKQLKDIEHIRSEILRAEAKAYPA